MASRKIEVEASVLEQLIDFYSNIEAADAVYKPCQDKNFRQHAKACLSAMRVEIAVKTARNLLREEANYNEK